MKNIVALLVFFGCMQAFADKEMRVISRNSSAALSCEVIEIDDGYNEPMMVKYTTCKSHKVVLEAAKSNFEVVLKVQGLDSFSQDIINKGMARGEHLDKLFTFQIIGAVY